MHKMPQLRAFQYDPVQKWPASATKVTRAGQSSEVPWSDGSFGAGEQRLNGFMRHQVDLVIGCPSIHSQCDQFLVLPSGALENRFLQRVQGQTQLGGLAAPGCLHRIFAKSKARANSGHRHERTA